MRNDDSIVLELALGDVSVVLPGDIGPAVERVLAAEDMASPRSPPPALVMASMTNVSCRRTDAGRAAAGLEGAASRQQDVEHRGIPRCAAAAPGDRQRRAWQPARPSRAGRARTIRGARNGGVQNGSGRRDSARHGRSHADVRTCSGRRLTLRSRTRCLEPVLASAVRDSRDDRLRVGGFRVGQARRGYAVG